MPNYPNRGPKGPQINPAPEAIRTAREAAGLTQTEAAALIHCARGAWAQWEAGQRAMHPAFWDLFGRIVTERAQSATAPADAHGNTDA